MKCLLIFPPQWIPFNPHLAPAAIQSILTNNGYDTHFRDLNAEFYNTVLTPAFLLESIERAFKIYGRSATNIYAHRKEKKDLKEFPKDFQRIYLRLKEIEKIANIKEFPVIAQYLVDAVSIFKDSKRFYDHGLLDKALSVIKKATDILSSVYYPSKVNFLNISAQTYSNIEELKLNCFDSDGNIFYHFYIMILQSLLQIKPDYIGISIGDYTQIIPALTLSMLLKKFSKAHINIGGNLFSRHTDVLINSPDFFHLFADSIIYNEGEKPLLELIKYLKGEIKIEDVPNLIHCTENKVTVNQETTPLKINELYASDYSSFPLKSYYTPEVILNIQASRNCYWRKCSFCTHHFGSQYSIKPVWQIVDEISELQEKFGARYFHFVDEAIPPTYLLKLSEEIISRGLNIDFYIYCRFENSFTPEIFRTARQAGLRFILWGFESANERVYTLMKKGGLCNPDDKKKIIQSAFDAEIWNHLFVMFGFPTETLEEAKETVHFLKETRAISSQSTGAKFILLEGAPILKNLEEYSITKIEKVRAGFSFNYKYETSEGMSKEQFDELDRYKNNHWELPEFKYKDSSFREKIFLYVCKYGSKGVSRMKNEKIWL